MTDDDITGDPHPDVALEIEERAAILEYEGGFSRAEAERLARVIVLARAEGPTAQLDLAVLLDRADRARLAMVRGVETRRAIGIPAEWAQQGTRAADDDGDGA